MELQLAPGHYTKANVTTKKKIHSAEEGTRLRVIVEGFRLVKEGGKTLQVYSDGFGFPYLHVAMDPEEIEDYFDDVELLPNLQ